MEAAEELTGPTEAAELVTQPEIEMQVQVEVDSRQLEAAAEQLVPSWLDAKGRFEAAP